MKKITAIVRPEKLEPLKEALFAAQVVGHDHLAGAGLRQAARVEGVLPWHRGHAEHDPEVKFELVVDDGEVGPLVDLIRATARTGEVGDGKIFVFPVEDVVRIRDRGNRRGCRVEDAGLTAPTSQCVTAP